MAPGDKTNQEKDGDPGLRSAADTTPFSAEAQLHNGAVSTGEPNAGFAADQLPPSPQLTMTFWSILLALCMLGLSTSLEATIVATALPTIVRAVDDVGSRYSWVGNAFLLASAVPQPFIGQLADIFGRRWPLLILTALFTVGSGIAGGADGAGMLIAGRTVQGLGAGGIFVLVDVVVCDLVPLQQRAKFLGLVRMSGAIGFPLGPIVGGVIADANWRWCFYLTLVTSGLSFICLVLFLNLKHKQSPWKTAVGRIDYFGMALFTSSVTALLLGLLMGGSTFPWRSAKVIVPIILGTLGWAAFHIFESTRFSKEPMVPNHLFTNRTAAAGFFMAFDGALLIYWVIWFLPMYFQGILGSQPLRSGVQQLPFNLLLVPSAMVAGGVMAKTAKYKPQHFVGFALVTIGIGLFTLLDKNSHTAAWVCFQIISAIGLGVIMTAVLPAIQAALSEDDNARSTATYTFLRSFGGIWGITIPSVIFNGEIDKHMSRVGDDGVRQLLSDGRAYGFASQGGVQALPEGIRDDVLDIYTDALKTVWQVGIAFGLAGFLAAFAVKQYDMSREKDETYGIGGQGDNVDEEKGDDIQKGIAPDLSNGEANS